MALDYVIGGEILMLDRRTPYYSCYYIENGMIFAPHEMSFCCIRAPFPVSMKPLGNAGETINRFFELKQSLISKNQTESAPCRGCKLLKYDVWDHADKIQYLNFSTHSWCNFSCSYCFLQQQPKDEKNKPEEYDSLEIAREVQRLGLLSDNVRMVCSPGEITVHPRRQEYFEFLEKHAAYVDFASNAGIFDERMAKIMSQKRGVQLLVSLDSGTEETFTLVRGVPLFSKVWQNLKKYRQYTPNILLKYILLEENCGQKDLDGFIELCKDIQPLRVVISADMHKASTLRLDVKAESNIIEAAVYLCKKLIENRMHFSFEDYLGMDNLKAIWGEIRTFPEIISAESKLERMLSKENVIMYGAGVNARSLLNTIETLGLRKPDMLWDIKAQLIFQRGKTADCFKNGYPLYHPDFSQLGDHDSVLISIGDPKINHEIMNTMLRHGFENFLSYDELRLALTGELGLV